MGKESVVGAALAMVGPAETAFSSRWRMSTLARLDPELHRNLEEQRHLYDNAMLMGSDADVRIQSEAMVRGWQAACRRMECPLQPDDAYMVGVDLNTCTRVVIGDHKQSAARMQRSDDGRDVYFLTPDEVAAMFGAFTTLRAVKDVFPDAELLGVTQFNREHYGRQG